MILMLMSSAEQLAHDKCKNDNLKIVEGGLSSNSCNEFYEKTKIKTTIKNK